MSQQRVAVITGISSGIGLATAAELVQRGFRVFGTVRAGGGAEGAGVEQVVLDVRDDESVKRGVEQIPRQVRPDRRSRQQRGQQHLGRHRGDRYGPGAGSLRRELLRCRANDACGAPQDARPALGPYRLRQQRARLPSGAVHGVLRRVQTRHRGLRRIAGPRGSRARHSRHPGRAHLHEDPPGQKCRGGRAKHRRLCRRARAVGAGLNASVASGGDPSIVAAVIAEALAAEHPRVRYPVGKGAGMLAKLRSFLPARTFDRSFRKQFHLEA